MHRPGQGREVLSSAVFKPASLSWINKTCVCNQSILNEGKENVTMWCLNSYSLEIGEDLGNCLRK